MTHDTLPEDDLPKTEPMVLLSEMLTLARLGIEMRKLQAKCVAHFKNLPHAPLPANLRVATRRAEEAFDAVCREAMNREQQTLPGFGEEGGCIVTTTITAELTERERHILAIALVGVGTRQRHVEGLAEQITRLADKLGLLLLLEEHSREWVEWRAQQAREAVSPPPTPPPTP